MLKVNNGKTLRMITRGFMRANRKRNLMIIVSILMTTVMFSVLLTVSVSMISGSQQMEMRTMSDASHVRAQNLTRETFERVRQYDEIKESGYIIYGAAAENKALGNVSAELMQADEKGAESRLALPETGRMPEKEREAAMSTLLLDLLGVPHRLGSRVELTFTLQGETVTEAFTLCGFWKGDELALFQPVWVSPAFAGERFAAVSESSGAADSREESYELAMWFSSPFSLQERAAEIDMLYDISSSGGTVSANTAYDVYGADGFSFSSAAVILAVIFAAGALIIFNLFNLSVKNDLHTYGLLRNIGITGKQMKKIVRLQALYLSAAGVPTGLAAGYFAAKLITPYVAWDMTYGAEPAAASAHPLLFAAAAVLSLFTVYMGCRRPARMAAKLSPVEALRESQAPAGARGAKGSRQKVSRGRQGRISPISMARENFRANRKKAAVVILSLALPLVILNSVYAIAKGFHYEDFVDAYMTMDVRISGCTQNLKNSNLQAVTEQVLSDIEERDEVESLAAVYDTETFVEPDSRIQARMTAILEKGEQTGFLDDYQLKQEEQMLSEGKVYAHVMGLSEDAFSQITFADGSCSRADFFSGRYVVVNPDRTGLGQLYRPGDKVELSLGEGETRTFTVAAAGDLNYELQYPFAVETQFDQTFLLPEAAYFDLGAEDRGAMAAGVQIEEGREEAFDRWLRDYLADQSLYADSRLSLEREARRYAEKYYVALGLLCGMLFVIGVMNFFNTAAVSIMARKRELALLSAVGMTRGQILRMLAAEGVFYIAGALIAADLPGSLLSRAVISKTVGKAFFFTPGLSVTMSFLALPLLVMMAVLIPACHLRKTERQSVVERLRVE